MVDEFMAAVFSRWPGVVVQVSHPTLLPPVICYTLIMTTPYSLKSHLLKSCTSFFIVDCVDLFISLLLV